MLLAVVKDAPRTCEICTTHASSMLQEVTQVRCISWPV